MSTYTLAHDMWVAEQADLDPMELFDLIHDAGVEPGAFTAHVLEGIRHKLTNPEGTPTCRC